MYLYRGTCMGIFMKKCFKCNQIKPLSDFYKHKAMADGHVNKCKECNKVDVKLNRQKRADYYKEYDAWRFQNQPQVRARHEKYRKTESCTISMRGARKKWDIDNPIAKAAHGIVARAIRSGKLHKPINCERCGNFTKSRSLHGHHDNYNAPLDVEWLCFKCHKILHRND